MPETVTQVHTFDQPIETSIKVGIEVDSKGQRKPSVEIKITRKFDNPDEVTLFLDDDIRAALVRCKSTLVTALGG